MNIHPDAQINQSLTTEDPLKTALVFQKAAADIDGIIGNALTGCRAPFVTAQFTLLDAINRYMEENGCDTCPLSILEDSEVHRNIEYTLNDLEKRGKHIQQTINGENECFIAFTPDGKEAYEHARKAVQEALNEHMDPALHATAQFYAAHNNMDDNDSQPNA